MSLIGTGIAAGVAQTTQQSQSLSRQQDKTRAEAKREQDATNAKVDQLLRTGATADADEELPDQQAPGYEQLYHGKEEPSQQDAEAIQQPTYDAKRPSHSQGQSDRPLYDHLDLQA